MDRHDSNPWLGLNTYSENDRLFGRDEEIRTVSDIILNNVLTVIYGRSGIGKSSLLRAGVFPRMRYEDFLPVYIRLEHNTEETYLSQIIRKVRDVSDTWNVRQSFGNVDSCQMTLARLLYEGSYRDGQSGLDKQILLVFDQFEEIFTLTDSRHKQDVKDFFCQLATTLNGSGNFADKGKTADFRIVICLREDYLYYLEQSSASIPSLKRNRYCLQALNHGQSREVMCNPRPDLVDTSTADAILGKIDHDDSGTIDPAILSLFMHELYEKGSGVITLDNISRYGDNIITSFYEEGMKAVSARSAAFLEDRLVTSDGYRHTLSYSDALSAGMTEQELNTLRDRRIITIEKGDKNQRIVELSHDILCPIVTKNRSERKLKEEAERLKAKNKAIRRRNRVVIAVCAVALAIVAVFACMLVEIRQRQDSMFVAQSRFVAEKAMELYEEGETVKALALAAEVYPHVTKHPDRPIVKEVTDCLYEILVNTNIDKVLSGHSNWINSASFSPDGTKVATASDDNTAIIWDVETGQVLRNLRHSDKVNSASFSPDGTKIVTAAYDSTAIIWDAETGQVLRNLRHSAWINSASFNPDGSKVITASNDSSAIIWDVETGQVLRNLRHSDKVNSASFSPNGSKVVTASSDNTAIIWDTESGKTLQTLAGHSGWIVSASFSPDGKKVVTASSDNTAIIWDTESGKTLQTLAEHSDEVNSASFSPDGKKVVTASWDNTVIIWDAEKGKALHTLAGHSDLVNSASFSPDGKKVVTVSWDNTAIIWNTESSQHKRTLYGFYNGSVNSASFSPDGKKVVTASNDGTVIIWETESGLYRLLYESSYMRLRFNSASFSPDGKKIVIASNYGHVIICDMESGLTLRTLSRHIHHVNSASFSPDGSKIVMASFDGSAIICDAESGHTLRTLEHFGLRYASFSPDGSKIVTVSDGDTAIIWDAESGLTLRTLNHSRLCSASFSPDGSKIVTASLDDATIWDVGNGLVLRTLAGHAEVVNSASFSPDGSKIVTASGDDTAIIWDTESGQAMQTLTGHSDQVNSASFSPDGSKIVTASGDGTAIIWPYYTPQELIDRALSILNGYKLSLEDRRKYYLD